MKRFLDPIALPGTKASSFLGVSVPYRPPLPLLWEFYWYFLNQAKVLFFAFFLVGLGAALIDVLIPIMIGYVLNLLLIYSPYELWLYKGQNVLFMGFVVLIGKPFFNFIHNLLMNQGVNASFTSLVRWQSHWHVIRKGLPFFQEELSGRIASRVMQIGPVLRESIIKTISTAWYLLVFGGTGIFILASMSWYLSIPILLWIFLSAILLYFMLPQFHKSSRLTNECQSILTGRTVDVYSNIQTVKLFARLEDEDEAIRTAHHNLNGAVQYQMSITTLNGLLISILNSTMLTTTAAISIWLWTEGMVSFQIVATALPLAWQISSVSGLVTSNFSAIFENIGVVQEAMNSITSPAPKPYLSKQVALNAPKGEIIFEAVSFGYGQERGVLKNLDLQVEPGERIGLIGYSGAGKSTLVNLLLGLYQPESGRILVDGQDISKVTHESLLSSIGVVTQDTALFHRSILENISYGRPNASMAQIIDASERACADKFIREQTDWCGRVGYEAHVGERGAKLSGGQRQRIAIARVLLKNAPILVLDEATNALDSDVEAAIQEQLSGLMEGKTVIAIAHRLSTIVKMDRLLVLDNGQFIEQGTHDSLLSKGGIYAKLWQQQSGDFLNL